MLISGEPFLVMAVDNFGFIVIDLVSNTAIEEVNFRKFYPSINDFSILKLVPIAENGIRVIMQDGGAFSFIWRGLSKKYIQYFIGRVGDGGIFEGAQTTTSFLDITGDISSPLVEKVDGVGLVQLVYYRQNNGFLEAFVRLYNYFNRENSKVFQEYSLGRVRSCQSLSVIDVQRGVSLT